MRKSIFLALTACCLLACAPKPPVSEMDRFVSKLMSRMTLDEKIGQLNLSGGDIPGVMSGTNGIDEAIRKGMLTSTGWNTVEELRRLQEIAVTQTRLGIPLMCGLDVIHGFGTIFPIPLAISCAWDTTLVERSARIAAIEATSSGVSWTYSPMVDIARDARWGRIAEGAGEDPWWGSKVAAAMVRGYQGKDLGDSTTLLACVKHFGLYGAAEAGRDYNTVDMSRVRMFNEYLPPYKAAVEAGCATAMSSFNLVEGIPASGNRWLMTEVLRDQWGFDGFVVSDYDAIGEMTAHGLGDKQTVSALALKAGVDMDMMTQGYIGTLKKSLEEGLVSLEDIDTACRRILEAKYKLGLFEDPYRYLDAKKAEENFMTPAHLAFAREIARKSIVLLKNGTGVLPLAREGAIAVVGPMAFTKEDLLGMWSGTNDQKSLTIAEAFRENAGAARIVTAEGCHLTDDPYLAATSGLKADAAENERLIREAVAKARTADVVVAVLGEPRYWTGEACSRADIGLPDSQKALLKALKQLGKPLVLVLANGRPLTLEWEDATADALVEAWHGGAEAARALTDVLFGDCNPSGKLTATFPRVLGQVPLYYNAQNTGRPMDPKDSYTSKYLDVPNDPLYPFGYGLSYTTFTYSPLQLNKKELKGGKDVLIASVDITNSGTVEGEEVVQLYIGDPAASISRPVKELKGFQKISLKAGETQTVRFDITPELLKFYNSQLVYDWEEGDFRIGIGPNSRDVTFETVLWKK